MLATVAQEFGVATTQPDPARKNPLRQTKVHIAFLQAALAFAGATVQVMSVGA
jgi:hypothetical protein